jgi:hypothetical protein
MISLRVSFALTIQDSMEPVQSSNNPNSRIFAPSIFFASFFSLSDAYLERAGARSFFDTSDAYLERAGARSFFDTSDAYLERAGARSFFETVFDRGITSLVFFEIVFFEGLISLVFLVSFLVYFGILYNEILINYFQIILKDLEISMYKFFQK